MLATDLLYGLENDIHNTPEKLAGQMALLAHDIRALIIATFNCLNGLAGTFPIPHDPRVLLLDLACGTGTFLFSLIAHVC